MPFEEIRKAIANDMPKYNLTMSNMTSSLNAPWVFQGSKVDWISLVGVEANHPCVSLVTHHDKIKLTIASD